MEYIILLGSIVILLIILSFVWPPDSPWAPWWRTSKSIAQAVCKLANIKKGDVVYELGCGEAIVLMVSTKEFRAWGVGIEIDPLRAFIATAMLHITKANDRIVIKRKNFFDEDLSGATVIFAYLVPKTLDKLIPKFRKELKKGTRIVTHRYTMNLPLKKKDSKNRLYLYSI